MFERRLSRVFEAISPTDKRVKIASQLKLSLPEIRTQGLLGGEARTILAGVSSQLTVSALRTIS